LDIPLFKVFMAESVTSTLGSVLQSGYVAQGQRVEEFEELLKDYTSTSLCASVNAGTSALHLALHLIREQAGDRNTILTIPLTCTATNFPILANGYDIRWVDTDPTTCNIDIQDLRRKLGPDVAGIMVVHWGGTPCDLDALKDVQDECERLYGYRPPIIEDAAHAFGAQWDNKMLGNHGNYVMHSFQAIKHLTTGDGGVLISPDYESHRRAKLLRWFGLDREKSPDMRCEQNVTEWGYKFHMNDINAAIGIENFKSIKSVVRKYKDNGLLYDGCLEGVRGVTQLKRPPLARSSYWIYTLRVERRDDFVKKLQGAGVACSRVHDRNDKHACLSKYRAVLPGTDEVCADMICIPCGWWMGPEDIDRVAGLISEGW
jgi:dTDP-4-amino-4,6-dideoxygalactose transaminase